MTLAISHKSPYVWSAQPWQAPREINIRAKHVNGGLSQITVKVKPLDDTLKNVKCKALEILKNQGLSIDKPENYIIAVNKDSEIYQGILMITFLLDQKNRFSLQHLS